MRLPELSDNKYLSHQVCGVLLWYPKKIHLIYLGVCVQSLSCAQLFSTPWTAANQAPLPMEFSRQAYWRELPFSTPGVFPDRRMQLEFHASPAFTGEFFLPLDYLRSPIYLGIC